MAQAPVVLGQRILVILEELPVREECLQYAEALAKRVTGRLTLLLLLPHGTSGVGAEEVGSTGEWPRTRDGLEGRGVPTEACIRCGDPLSELLKFLATRPSYHMAIWGGEVTALPQGRAARQADHWVARLGSHLGCPLVTPRKRSTT